MTATTIDRVGERALVDRVLELLGVGDAPPSVMVGPGDDAAVVVADSPRLALTTDSQIEGVHFRRDWIGPEALGKRAIAVNVSDLAAMGATPGWVLVALSLPADVELAWVEELTRGLSAGASDYGCPVAGGDVARVPERIGIHITAVGTFADGVTPTCRDSARAGDGCWVTGHPGRAAAGRDLLEAGFRPDDLPETAAAAAALCLEAYVRPQPPVALGGALAASGLVTAMIDISDGVAIDLLRICSASGVGVILDREALVADPVLEALAAPADGDPEEWILGGGEDYQLLCAVPDEAEGGFVAAAAAAAVEAHRVGRFASVEEGCSVAGDEGVEPLEPRGWNHFSVPGDTR